MSSRRAFPSSCHSRATGPVSKFFEEKPMKTDAKTMDWTDSRAFGASTIEERFESLVETWGQRLVASTSFGIQSSVMLHLISRYTPSTPVVFIDTGFLFPETYCYVNDLANLLDINLHIYTPKFTAARICLLYTSPSPRDLSTSRMPSSA